ncbi:MAG: homoserine dehydrogenase [Chloroflexota bacterium]
MKIALIGFGTVGQGFVEILRDKGAALRRSDNFGVQIVSVATRTRGALSHPEGLDPVMLLDAIADGGTLNDYPDQQGLIREWGAMDMVTQSNAEVVVEMTASDLDTAMPALEYTQAALRARKHVILANKGPVAIAFQPLQELAAANGVQLRYEATVMAGTPSLQLALDALKGNTITRARGILNGTTNYILTQMESGTSYEDALTDAQTKGYAESDPSADVDGWDAAGKVLILANALFGVQLELKAMDVTGISGLTSDDIAAASAVGERYRLIAEATPDGGSVKPVRLPLSDPLAGVSGATNAVTYSTDLMGDVTLVGAGAGRTETGFAILADLLAIHRTR